MCMHVDVVCYTYHSHTNIRTNIRIYFSTFHMLKNQEQYLCKVQFITRPFLEKKNKNTEAYANNTLEEYDTLKYV